MFPIESAFIPFAVCRIPVHLDPT